MLWCCGAKEDRTAHVIDVAPFHDSSEVLPVPEIDVRSLAKESLDQLGGISFVHGTTEMTKAGRTQAAKYAKILNSFPDMAVKLVGCCSEDLPTPSHNEQLARDRCRAARVFLGMHHCSNHMAIQGKGKTSSCTNEVTVELCETEQVEILEAAAVKEDAVFVQAQKKVEETIVEAPAAKPEPVAEAPAPVFEEARLNLVFSDDRGNVIKCQLTQRPLGVTFAAGQTPLAVKSCRSGSHAQELGVKVGMVVTTIDGASISNKNYDKAWEMLLAAVSRLPNANSEQDVN